MVLSMAGQHYRRSTLEECGQDVTNVEAIPCSPRNNVPLETLEVRVQISMANASLDRRFRASDNAGQAVDIRSSEQRVSEHALPRPRSAKKTKKGLTRRQFET